MPRKIIIGICYFTGSDVKKSVKKIKRFIPCNIHSVFNSESLEMVFDAISKDNKKRFHIIHPIRSVEEMTYTKRVFPNDTVEFIGIDVHYEDRFKNLLAKKWITEGISPKEWYDVFQKEDCEKNTEKCFERIPFEFKFKYQEGCHNTTIGEIVDLILRS
jgi:hypothetical protein